MREGEKSFVVSEGELGEELDEELLQEEEGAMGGSWSTCSCCH